MRLMIQNHISFSTLAVQLDSLNLCLCFRMFTVGHFLFTGNKLIKIVIPFIITVQNDISRFQCKQFALSRCIILHGFMIIQMILCQIGHHCCLNRHSVKLVLVKRVRRDFQHDIVHISLFCITKELLHPASRSHRCVQIINLSLPCHLDQRRREHRCLKFGLLQDLIDIAGGRCLPVGASYCDNSQVF